MKAIAAILLLAMSDPVLAESANPPPAKAVKSDQPYVYDSMSRPIPKTPASQKPSNTNPPQKKDRELGIG